MTTLGIIANPASGKDIRRLVSHATVIDNNEKVNIIERIILAAQAFGVRKILMMPDSFVMGYKVKEKLQLSRELSVEIETLEMKVTASPADTVLAAALMQERGVGCVIVLGGDGTNRLAAKSLSRTPLIGISTGTNNAYPEMIEGTVVGIAAAAVASGRYSLEQFTTRDKRIEILRDGEVIDIALMDVVVTDEMFVGAKAIWNMDNIREIVVSRCHPASIGFSAIAGAKRTIGAGDDFGGSVRINAGTERFLAPIAAGTVASLRSEPLRLMPLGEMRTWEFDHAGIIAVDGEREIRFHEGDRISVRITRNGPIHIDVRKALEVAQKGGFFDQI